MKHQNGGGLIDLHLHSTASDGTVPPEALPSYAGRRGVYTIALTDHDTVSGIKTAQLAGEAVGVRVIAGVELSCESNLSLHLLGYFIDPDNPALLETLERMRQARETRALQMIAKLRGLGIPITLDLVGRHAGGRILARPHIARALIELGAVGSVKEAFERYLSFGRPGFVPKPDFDAREAIALIRGAGGAAVLAHPRLIHLEPASFEPLLRQLIGYGLSGLECYYPNNSDEYTRYCLELCSALGLIPTGGSDFHGDNRPEQDIGCAQGLAQHPDDYPDCLIR